MKGKGLIKEELDPMKAQARADHLAALMASEKRLLDERDEFYKDVKIPDSVKTPQDHIDYVKASLTKIGVQNKRSENGPPGEIQQEKLCLNCGSPRIQRQYDEVNSTTKNIVWTDYKCLVCKERFNL